MSSPAVAVIMLQAASDGDPSPLRGRLALRSSLIVAVGAVNTAFEVAMQAGSKGTSIDDERNGQTG